MNRIGAVLGGLVMVAAVSPGVGLPVLALAVALVVLAMATRFASAAAVAVSIAALAVGDVDPVLAAVAGLAGAVHLMGSFGAFGTDSARTMLSASGFAAVATVAALIPGGVTWLPLAAPVAALVLFVLAVRPFEQLAQRQNDVRKRWSSALDYPRADQ